MSRWCEVEGHNRGNKAVTIEPVSIWKPVDNADWMSMVLRRLILGTRTVSSYHTKKKNIELRFKYSSSGGGSVCSHYCFLGEIVYTLYFSSSSSSAWRALALGFINVQDISPSDPKGPSLPLPCRRVIISLPFPSLPSVLPNPPQPRPRQGKGRAFGVTDFPAWSGLGPLHWAQPLMALS